MVEMDANDVVVVTEVRRCWVGFGTNVSEVESCVDLQ